MMKMFKLGIKKAWLEILQGFNMAAEKWVVDWSVGWVVEADVPIWRMSLQFQEDGLQVARTQIDCTPNPQFMAQLTRRAEQGLAVIGEGVVRECVREATNGLQRQLLGPDGMAEDSVVVGLGKGMAAEVLVRSRRVTEDDGNDKVLYFKEVPRIINQLHKESLGRLSRPQRRRIKAFYREKAREPIAEFGHTKPQCLSLSHEDPLHFYVDESGDTGFKGGSSEYYPVAFVVIPQSKKGPVEERLREILRQHMPPGRQEIKFSDVDRYADARKTAIYRECTAVLRQAPLALYASAVHKDGFILEKVRSQMAVYYYEGKHLPDLKGPFAPERVKDYPRDPFHGLGREFFAACDGPPDD